MTKTVLHFPCNFDLQNMTLVYRLWIMHSLVGHLNAVFLIWSFRWVIWFTLPTFLRLSYGAPQDLVVSLHQLDQQLFVKSVSHRQRDHTKFGKYFSWFHYDGNTISLFADLTPKPCVHYLKPKCLLFPMKSLKRFSCYCLNHKCRKMLPWFAKDFLMSPGKPILCQALRSTSFQP